MAKVENAALKNVKQAFKQNYYHDNYKRRMLTIREMEDRRDVTKMGNGTVRTGV